MNTTPDNHFDSLLFDMDGTLWDAVNSYCAVWNAAIAHCCPSVPQVTYERLEPMMGRPMDVIFNEFIGDNAPYDYFMEHLHSEESRLMPQLGGRLYPGVFDTVRKLSADFRLFLVSNCTPNGLPNFLAYTGMTPFFTDTISFGETGREKDYNIRLLIEKHGLKKPLYIGDTKGDGRSAHAAGIPFAWADYGFGHGVDGQEFTISRLSDLLDICRPLGQKS